MSSTNSTATDRTDEFNTAVAEAAITLLAAETVWSREDLAAMNGEKLTYLFNATFGEAETESDEQDDDATARATEGDDDVATNAAPGGRQPSPAAGAGTMADYCERHSIEGGTGDARRANSDRYHVPLETDEMQANADGEPSDDYPAGTMADYLGRDLDPVVPRRQQAQQDATGDESEQGGDFDLSDNEDAENGDVAALNANQSAYERRKQAEENPAPGTMAAYRAKQQDDDE